MNEHDYLYELYKAYTSVHSHRAYSLSFQGKVQYFRCKYKDGTLSTVPRWEYNTVQGCSDGIVVLCFDILRMHHHCRPVYCTRDSSLSVCTCMLW